MSRIACLAAIVCPAAARAQSDDITKSENWPCDTCHPVGAAEGGDLAHEVTLEGHDRLGRGRAACLYCHSADAAPQKLLALDGRTVPIESDVPSTCERCHFGKVREWRARAHGKGLKCTNAHCHSPHSPSTLRISLAPFGADAITLRIGRKRTPIKALPAVIGGPAPARAGGVALAAGAALAAFVVLAGLALRDVVRRGGRGRR